MKSATPLISVLMPAHNAEKYVSAAIDSILAQTYEYWELLICDDASTDNTWEVINKYKDCRILRYRNTINKKKPQTVNELYRTAKGELITVHDADDFSHKRRFEKIVNLFLERTDVYACGHEIERVSEDGIPLGLFRRKDSDYEVIKERNSVENIDGDPSLFFKRSVVENLGGEIFRAYFQNNMDYDFALRVIENYKTTNLQEVLSYYRNVAGSISKSVPTYHKLVTRHITKSLAKQRRELGFDALQMNDLAAIRDLEEQFSQPYVEDQTLHFREMAAFFMYCQMNQQAIRYMKAALNQEPFKLENWRTLQYCVRRTFLTTRFWERILGSFKTVL